MVTPRSADTCGRRPAIELGGADGEGAQNSANKAIGILPSGLRRHRRLEKHEGRGTSVLAETGKGWRGIGQLSRWAIQGIWVANLPPEMSIMVPVM